MTCKYHLVARSSLTGLNKTAYTKTKINNKGAFHILLRINPHIEPVQNDKSENVTYYYVMVTYYNALGLYLKMRR